MNSVIKIRCVSWREMLIGIGALATFILVASTLSAQETDSFRIGSVGFVATASAGVHFTDNVNNTRTNRENDYWFTEDFNLTGTTRMAERHLFRFSAGLGLSQHPDNRRLDSVTPLDFAAQLKLDYSPFIFSADERFSYESDASRQFFTAAVARFDIYRNRLILTGQYLPPSWDFSLKYERSDRWYGSGREQIAFVSDKDDYNRFTASGSYHHKFERGFTGKVGFTQYLTIRHGNSDTSSRAVLGLSGPLTPQVNMNLGGEFTVDGPTYYRSTIGFESAFSPTFKYGFDIGLAVTESPKTNKIRYTLVLKGNASQQLGQYTSHGLIVSIEPNDPFAIDETETDEELTDEMRVGYRISHRLTERLSLYGVLSWNRQKTIGAVIDETSTQWTVNVGTGYQLSRRISLNLNYTHLIRQSDLGSDREYYRNTVSLKGTYRF